MACSLSDPLFEDLLCRSDWVMAGNWVRSRPSRRSRYLPRLCAAAHVAQDVQLTLEDRKAQTVQPQLNRDVR